MAGALSSASASTLEFQYDVFLSFHGEDTRRTFTDHLYHELHRNNVKAFRDSDGLQKGVKITELFEVIKRSKIFIPILSENYAHSTWCLKEIEQIIKVAEEEKDRRLILPVFYRIKPTDIGRQTGPFQAAFQKHEKDKVGVQTMNEWRGALVKVTCFSGYESEKIRDGHEVPLIEMIVQRVLQELHNISEDIEHLVGIKSRANDIIEKLDINSNGARMVGIHGMGGLGKTTVAKAVYKKLNILFKFHCFIDGISKKSLEPEGLVLLRRQLMREISKVGGTCTLQTCVQNKKVLIVLDDVDSVEQVEALAGKREWFHPGSRIIITTRDEGVLAIPGWGRRDEDYIIYSLKKLDEDESIQLFSWYAFGKDSPVDGYEELSFKIVQALHGLPLAIKILASNLYDNTYKEDWNETVLSTSKLSGLCDDRIYSTLKASYDRLSNSDQRSIFLDVACFLSGFDAETAIRIWDACGFSSRLSIKALCRKSLIKITNGKLEMDNILREMGRHIVIKERRTVPKSSRLWIQEEIMDVLEQEKGTSKIEGISLVKAHCGQNHDKERRVKASGFASMDKLRLLMINHVHMKGGYKRMPKHIKWLQWQRCPLKFLPPDFLFKEVAALDLSYSNITQVRRSNKGLCKIKELIGIKKAQVTILEGLKVLDLTARNNLTITPDLSAFPGLEKLVMDRCCNLVKIHESMGNLKMLVTLSMESCEKLEELPDCMSQLTSLEQLNLANCFSLERLPDRVRQLSSLQKLDISNTSYEIRTRPISFGSALLGSPSSIEMATCSPDASIEMDACSPDSSIEMDICSSVPFSFQNDLRILHLDDCQLLAVLPEWVLRLRLLEELSLSNCSLISKLPGTIGSLKKLRRLNLSGCGRVQALPDDIGHLESLIQLLLESTSIVELPESLGRLRNLEILHLGSCERLERLPSSIGNLENLTQLLLDSTNIVELPSSIASLQKLELLSVRECRRLKHLPNELKEDLLLLCDESQVETAIN